MKKVETLLVALSIISIALNLLLVPISAIATILTFSLMSLMYLCLSFSLFNNIALQRIFKSESYRGLSSIRIVGSIISGIVLSLGILALLFRYMQWPGGYILSLQSLAMLSIIIVTAFIKYIRTKDAYYPRVLKRVGTVGFIILIMMYIPGVKIVSLKYRNHPAYVEAYKKHAADPMNEELRKKLDEERQNLQSEK